MKVSFVVLAIFFLYAVSLSTEELCEDKGCYEVIKTFAEFIEFKINDTDKVSHE